MNILLWVLQILLALHTIMGAAWKFSHSEQAVPSLKAIPHGIWMAMIPFELLCSLALVLPVFPNFPTNIVPIAAACIAGEMLFFCGVHFYSGHKDFGPVIYWLVVAAFCAFIAYGRIFGK